MDEDHLTLFVERENEVFVPNIFSPNDDGVNDELVVYGGEGVEEIVSFIVFDRWGNVVFSAEHFQVNDVTRSWDGKFKGQKLNPSVFAYRMIVKFKDGVSDVVYGDVTLVR
jgi:gliding motility-associated-like protein